MRISPALIAAVWLAGSVAAQDPPAAAPASSQPGRPAEERLAPALVSGPRELFLKGVKLFESGNLAQARTVFKALTLAYPELPEPHVNLAVVLAAEGDAGGSAESAEAAILHHPICRAAFQLELVRDLETSVATAVPSPERAVAESGIGDAALTSAVSGYGEEIRTATAMVHAWATAWADQRPGDYLAFYGSSFQPPGGASRERWEAARRERLARPTFIEIGISDLEVDVASAGWATATFTQTYRSDSFRDVVRKALELARMGESWRIVGERTAP